jgi:hypothetical protein
MQNDSDIFVQINEFKTLKARLKHGGEQKPVETCGSKVTYKFPFWKPGKELVY